MYQTKRTAKGFAVTWTGATDIDPAADPARATNNGQAPARSLAGPEAPSPLTSVLGDLTQVELLAVSSAYRPGPGTG